MTSADIFTSEDMENISLIPDVLLYGKYSTSCLFFGKTLKYIYNKSVCLTARRKIAIVALIDKNWKTRTTIFKDIFRHAYAIISFIIE